MGHSAKVEMNSDMNHQLDHIDVEVVYALPQEQEVFYLKVEASSTVDMIIEQSGVLSRYLDIDLTKNKVGVFSRMVKLDATVREGDRIEIYRPLLADPKEIRRQRAEQAKQKK